MNKRSKRESAALASCPCSFDDDDVTVLGMPWQRGHTLAVFSALCLSQRFEGGSGALTQLPSLPRLPPSPPPPPARCAPPPPLCPSVGHSPTPVFASTLLPFNAPAAFFPHLSPFTSVLHALLVAFGLSLPFFLTPCTFIEERTNNIRWFISACDTKKNR